LRLQAPRLDRIVRGRAWIPVLGAMLVAIVGLRVAVLKLGANVGSEIQQATLLESSNTTLRTQISALSDNQRIEKLAEQYGMHMPNPLDVHFVAAAAGTHVQAAIHGISSPDGSTYLTNLAAEQHHDEAVTQGTASLSGVGAATGVTTGTAGGTVGTTAGTAGTAGTTGGTPSAGTGATTSSTTGPTTGTVGGQTSANTSSTGTAAGTVQTSSTTGTDSGATQSTGTSDLNTGVTNTDPSSNASQTSGAPTSANGATGLAG
jgi:cell division protein FtsL